MRTTQEAAWVAQTETPTGVDRRAQRLRLTPEAVLAADSGAEAWVRGAITLLWALIDKAVAQVNAARERRGLVERLAVRRTSHEYWLTAPGPDGTERCVAVLVSLRAVHGHAQGGGYEGAAQVAEVKLFQDGDGACEGAHSRGCPHLPHPARVGPGQEPLQALRVGRDARANPRLRQGREVPRQPGHDRPVGEQQVDQRAHQLPAGGGIERAVAVARQQGALPVKEGVRQAVQEPGFGGEVVVEGGLGHIQIGGDLLQRGGVVATAREPGACHGLNAGARDVGGAAGHC